MNQLLKTPLRLNACMDIETSMQSLSNQTATYRTNNPFGVGYTDSFDHFLTSHRVTIKLYNNKTVRKIDFVEVS